MMVAEKAADLTLGNQPLPPATRTRGFTTDVEQVGTLRNKHKSVVDRGGRIDISAAIRKQVGVALTIPQTSGPCLRQATQQAIAGAHR